MKKLRAYLTLFRISNLPTMFSNVLVGISLSEDYEFSFTLWKVFFACAAFYIAGMVFNDFFDYQWDKKYRPDKPLALKVITKKEVLWVGISLMAFALFILLSINISTFLSGLILAFFIMLYDLWHKNNRFSSVIMGLCRVMVYIIAFLAFSQEQNLEFIFSPSLLLMIYLIGITHIASYEHKNNFLKRNIPKFIAGICLIDMVNLIFYTDANIFILLLCLVSFLLTIFLQGYISGT